MIDIKDKIRHVSWLISRSLYLDSNLVKNLELTSSEKTSLLVKKYSELLKTHVFKSEERKVSILGHDYYYFDPYAHSLLISIILDNLFLRKYLKPGSIIVDIGANIGQYYFFAKHILKAKQVFSFEPLPFIFKILKKNNPTSYNLGISTKKNGKITIPDCDIFASMCIKPSSDSIPIKLAKLDGVDAIKKLTRIDLLKIDVEGAELDVLKSAGHSLKKSRYLLVEMSVDRPSMGDIQTTFSFLKTNFSEFKVIYMGLPLIRFDKCECVDVLFKNTHYAE
jgi:FkbM family methyltransferase